MEVHQILPTLSPGDAIGNEVMQMQELLLKWGYKSEIYAENIHPSLSSKARSYKDYSDSPDNILIFHYSIGSDITGFVKGLRSKVILRYHNITPSHFFKGFNDYLGYLCSKGRDEICSIRNVTRLCLANSEYSRHELDELGFKNTAVLPLIIDFSKYNVEDKYLLNKYDDNTTNILFVGRIIPQKRQEDMIKSFYYYNKYINTNSRLFLVGNYNGYEDYHNYLTCLITKLNLTNVFITNMVDFKSLISYYKLADVFICMSEWESFCVPLVECMYFGVPIIAYNSTVIPDTLGGSGILVNKKDYRLIAELINLVVEDSSLRDKIIKKQNERLTYFSHEHVTESFNKFISTLL